MAAGDWIFNILHVCFTRLLFVFLISMYPLLMLFCIYFWQYMLTAHGSIVPLVLALVSLLSVDTMCCHRIYSTLRDRPFHCLSIRRLMETAKLRQGWVSTPPNCSISTQIVKGYVQSLLLQISSQQLCGTLALISSPNLYWSFSQISRCFDAYSIVLLNFQEIGSWRIEYHVYRLTNRQMEAKTYPLQVFWWLTQDDGSFLISYSDTERLTVSIDAIRITTW